MTRVVLHQFRDWARSLDEAVKELPEDADWPRALYLSMTENIPRDERKIVMWTESDVPVGIGTFVRDPRGTWEPVSQWILPGMT